MEMDEANTVAELMEKGAVEDEAVETNADDCELEESTIPENPRTTLDSECTAPILEREAEIDKVENTISNCVVTSEHNEESTVLGEETRGVDRVVPALGQTNTKSISVNECSTPLDKSPAGADLEQAEGEITIATKQNEEPEKGISVKAVTSELREPILIDNPNTLSPSHNNVIDNDKPGTKLLCELLENKAVDAQEGITETEKSFIEICDESSQSTNKRDITIEDGTETTTAPIFMDIDTNKDDNDKSTTGPEQDDDVDPIGEPESEWSWQTATEPDDMECIIPDNNRVLTQEEREFSSITDNTTNGDLASTSNEQLSKLSKDSELHGKCIVKVCNEIGVRNCMQCSKDATAIYTVSLDSTQTFLCSESCLKDLKDKNGDNVIMYELRVKNFAPQEGSNTELLDADDVRYCTECRSTLSEPEASLSWESLEFCDTKCILKYQKRVGSLCASCDKDVPEHFLGKYCVRFGFKIRQFCSSVCLVKYKRGLKVCSYCQEDIGENSSGFVANIEKGQFRDFCAVGCLEKYKSLKKVEKLNGSCAVCHKVKPIEIEYSCPTSINRFCSEPCFVAFKYVNNVQPAKCATCSKYYAAKVVRLHVVCTDGYIKKFCTKICQIVYINMHRKIVSCGWCKVKKYNFDMIQKSVDKQTLLMCSIPCLRLFEATPKTKNKAICNNCFEPCRVTYHIANDGGMKNFCTYQCVQDFQSKQNSTLRVADVHSVVPTIVKRVTRKNVSVVGGTRKQIIPDVPGPLPIITSVRSLAPTANNGNSESRSMRSKQLSPVDAQPPKSSIKHVVLIKPPDLLDIRNIMTMVKPLTSEQETHIKPECVDKQTQTDRFNGMDIEVIPIPIYVPQPVHTFTLPFIKPCPFPLPVPVPILMPLTKSAANGILKEVKTAQPTPSDPYEADLLVMAQLVADANENKAQEEPIVESDPDEVPADVPSYSPEPHEQPPTFGDDMLQIALNIATGFAEPAVDLEGALTASTITATASTVELAEDVPQQRMLPERSGSRGRKRGRPARGNRGRGRSRSSAQLEIPITSISMKEPPQDPVEKPDANMCLKYTFGVNAWKQWVSNKNNELEKSSRRAKQFKTDLLQLTSDELNYSLCLFVKEVRKPNGAEYAPDTIYYLCLGIQQYLFENARIDNIFCDPYYESFTDCLDEVCKKFSTLYNDSQYIVTRVEEEHLWESKQLGAHSPHVLLSTLMFFNTKHFNLTNVEEHMQLSFSHIMKHWKRMPSAPGGSKSTTSRNILLRFYPPQSAVEGKSKKKVYEQQENEDNPIRCPVKLYEFYLSKCPESVKTRNDVFYLQPERSCVPDSPVWYSTMALGTDSLEKMLHRVKMVKEINVAFLAS